MATPYSGYMIGGIKWYGVFIALGAALAVFLACKEEKRMGLPKDTYIDLALWVLPLGIFGARLYYVIFSWDTYRHDPLSVLYIWEGGLAIYGGLIAGLLTILVFCRKKKLSLLSVCDGLIAGVALAQAIGRWGNFFNQEAYGLPLSPDSPLSVFPLGVLIGDQWHMATFFYESILDFGIFLYLYLGRKKNFPFPGDRLFSYLFLYGTTRLLVENFRMDSLLAGGNTLRISQLLSVLICGGTLGFFGLRLRGNRSARKAANVLLCLSVLPVALLILYCLGPQRFRLTSAGSQFLFLFLCAAFMLILFLCFRRALCREEVPDAHHAR